MAIVNKRQHSQAFTEEINIDQVLQLNKLESHLLKIVIPFVRVAHCSRGSYIKVKGSLILISSDIGHSMSQILPRKQNLLPVCLKRKMEYSGNYMEEIIDKNKVKAYFTFFRRFNPLFNELEFREDDIRKYEKDCDEAVGQFEKAVDENVEEDIKIPDIEDPESVDSDSNEDEFDDNQNTYFNPIDEKKKEEASFFRDQTSVFCNKYEEDINIPTVASRLANIISEAEEHFELEIPDEIENEEINPDTIIHPTENGSMNLEDEVFKEAHIFDDILEADIERLSKKSAQKIRRTLDRVAKISVAPGEKGNFKNWGDDVFLEEKCFPELFPFGTGGYMSSLIDNEERDTGFAMYIKHRILSADSKYRKNNAYMFFLLIVKELVQLKRCKQTYMRQATKLPNLTKETIRIVKLGDLSHYNRSYEVFKTMRGTSMYYEDSKKNVMAILRQNGSPSLFVTLSCAEFSWEGLLKEILETVHNKEFTDEEVRNLTPQDKNRLISENVVQSTLHFQKRIEKELKLMTKPNFFDKDCNFRVSSYYYRVEFQQRGAPHIHTLLWLKDQEGKPAPTFWTNEEDSENGVKENQLDKMKKIEEIAKLLISASKENALCDKHKYHLNYAEANQRDCTICYSADANLEECLDHKSTCEAYKDCQNCLHLQKLVTDFQTHKHTFTCQKKNKVININEDEGHGRRDGKIKGPRIDNYVHCRFNFPQFPLNRTTFILGMSKDLDVESVNQRRKDLKKIKKYLIRQSHAQDNSMEESVSFKQLKSQTFLQFLHEVGMFSTDKQIENYTSAEKDCAYQRYINALSASIKGTGSVFLKRETKDLFTNNFNRQLMYVHKANHDIQIVVDQVWQPF
jgi:hypothetical protein